MRKRLSLRKFNRLTDAKQKHIVYPAATLMRSIVSQLRFDVQHICYASQFADKNGCRASITETLTEDRVIRTCRGRWCRYAEVI